MEALHSRLTTGEQPGDQDHSQPESLNRGPQLKSPSQHRQPQQTSSQKPHGTTHQVKQPRRQHSERKRLRHQRQSIDSDTTAEGKHAKATSTSAKATRVPCPSLEPQSSVSSSTHAKRETQEGTPKHKRERKPQRPGKYVCSYCSRACAKPSVLQKHIRSHTGERPYPCAPCGFSFKTKSNLYKHRKSHTHKVKAGLAFAEPRPLEEQVTESEDEARQLSSQSSSTEHQVSVTSLKSDETDRTRAHSGGMDDSYAVKKRLAMRLSRGKHGPLDSSDENNSSLILGSKGSTESGYFSRSESTEQSQDSPPNTSAKSYAEIILGKYGRLGQLQRMSRQQNQQTSGEEEKSIPFTVPKKQVIDHITKLITINEAVVDTSKIDSVKPRRFSLSRKSSTESQKSSPMKEPIIHSPKPGDPAYKTSGSITMGVPCDKFHHQPLNKDQLAAQTSTVPLSRSHSMPSTASSLDASSGSPCSFRPCQSFEERQPSQIQTSRRMGMLRRQPAIEIPLGAELPPEEHHSSDSFYHDNVTIVPDNKQSQPQPYECEACGTGCKDWEGYKIHKQSPCLAQSIKVIDIVSNQLDRPQLKSHPARPGVSVMRKRRKEESFESDDPSSPVVCSSPSSAFSTSQCRKESDVACEDIRRPTLQTFSVIQHTSSFEKQETLCAENIRQESANISPPRQEYQPALQKQPQQQHSTKPTPRKMVCHQNVRVPEILVTEDSKMHTECILEPIYNSKQLEKLEEFQWPQRSPTLAQLPIEKLPPKKKRLRLAEAAQSSGESSFDSVSLPRSPSQDSSASYASSRSTSFEESSRLDMEATSTTPLRRSRAPHTLTVPGTHQYREMRRSASEQAPHDPQPGVLIAESRSKSFDYSCLSPERSMVGWRERRKCLLMRHSAVRDPEEEEEGAEKEVKTQSAHLIPGPVSPSISSRTSPSAMQCGRSPRSPLTGDTVLGTPTRPPRQEFISQWKLSQNIQLAGKTDLSPIDGRTVDSIKEEPSSNCTVHPSSPPLQFPQHYLTQGPSGAARAHYLPMSTGLKLEIPSQTNNEYPTVRVNPPQILHSLPNITMNPELLRPYTPAAVAVRLQTDTLTPAYAIYTTQSQTIPTRLLEPVSAVSYHTSIPESAQRGNKATSAELEAWSADLLRSSGSGGNKRMLSPSNSIELSPESQQQQKRVKEEEERKDRGADKASVVASIEKKKFEAKLCLASICSPVRHIRTSFTSLDSNTCNSWCYLNYIKPNPSPLDEQRPSVYSSWSTGSYDPNPLGLSSKTALSLLHCKQRLSPSIYTMSPMSACTTETIEPDNQRPCSTEVNNQPSSDRDHADTMDKAPPVDDTRSNKVEQEEGKMGTPGASGEKVQSSSIYRDPLQRWTCEEGSSEAHGHSRCQVEEGGVKFECKEHSSEVENPGQCGLSSFDAKGDLSEHLRSQAHGRECEKEVASADNTNEGVCCGCPVDLEKQGDSRGSNVEGSSFDEVAKTKDEVSQDVMDPLTYPTNPEPKSSQRRTQAPKSPARDRRALFARQHQGPSRRGSSSLSLHLSPTESLSSSSPPCQGGPAPHSMSLSTCQVSLALARSPERGPAPARVQSPSSSSLSSAPRQALSPPRDRPATKTRLRRSESVDEPVARTLFFSSSAPYHNPSPSRGAHRVLSHLPLHSQRPSTAPSLTISIGGIHMIRPGIAPPRCSSQGHWPRPEAKESALNRDVPDTRATHTCDYPETAQTPKGSLQPEATLIGGSSYKGTVQKEVDVKRPQKP